MVVEWHFKPVPDNGVTEEKAPCYLDCKKLIFILRHEQPCFLSHFLGREKKETFCNIAYMCTVPEVAAFPLYEGKVRWGSSMGGPAWGPC